MEWIRGGLRLAALLCLPGAFFGRAAGDEESASSFGDLEAIRQAARFGHPQAQFKLGDYHMVTGDYTNAVAWYRKAAELGNGDAQLSLASCYRTGRGVAENAGEADRWARLATAQRRSAAVTLMNDQRTPARVVDGGGTADTQSEAEPRRCRVLALEVPRAELDVPDTQLWEYETYRKPPLELSVLMYDSNWRVGAK